MGAGYHSGGDLANRWYLLVWLLYQEWQDVNFQVDRLTCGKAYAIGHWLQYGSYNGFFTSVQPYWVGDLWASDEKLADFQLADLPAGSCLCPSLR